MPAAGLICGQRAGPDGCPRPVFARGLCRAHYRRAARGLPLQPDVTQVGSPSGHGVWGVVEVDSEGRLRCHDCGRWYVALAVHVGMRHGPTRDYRLRHGLSLAAPLLAAPLRARQVEAASTPQQAAHLAAVRDPLRALAAIDPEMILRGQRLAGRHHNSRAHQ